MSFSGLLRPLLPGLPIDEPTTPITGRSQWPRWQRVNLVEPQLPRLRKRPRMRRMLITYPHIEPLDNEIPANDPKAQAVVDRLQLPRRSTPAHDREKADRVTLCVVCHKRRGPPALLLLAEPVAHFVAPSAEPDGFIFVGKANTDASVVALQRLPKKVEKIAAGHGHLSLALPKRRDIKAK